MLLAATLNFGFFVGNINDPTLHNVFGLFAPVVINLLAIGLKFSDRTHVGATQLASSASQDSRRTSIK